MDEQELDRLLAPLGVEPAPADLKASVRQRLQAATAAARADQDLIEPAPADLKASVRAHLAQATARASATPVRKPQRNAVFALAASVVLGVALWSYTHQGPDLSGVSSMGGGQQDAGAAHDRICGLLRAGDYREAQAEYDKLVRRNAEPASKDTIDAYCRE